MFAPSTTTNLRRTVMKAIVVKDEFGITILFPEHASSLNPKEMMSWDETGGHGAAGEAWALEQKFASPEEAKRTSEFYTKHYGEEIEVVQDLGLVTGLRGARERELSSYYRLN